MPEDKANFARLLKEMRPVFDKHGLLITAAVSAGKNTVDKVPFIYYVRAVLGPFMTTPTHSLYQHVYSKKLPFSETTHPVHLLT